MGWEKLLQRRVDPPAEIAAGEIAIAVVTMTGGHGKARPVIVLSRTALWARVAPLTTAPTYRNGDPRRPYPDATRSGLRDAEVFLWGPVASVKTDQFRKHIGWVHGAAAQMLLEVYPFTELQRTEFARNIIR